MTHVRVLLPGSRSINAAIIILGFGRLILFSLRCQIFLTAWTQARLAGARLELEPTVWNDVDVDSSLLFPRFSLSSYSRQ